MDSKTILELRPLLKTFFPVAWLGHLGLGLTYGLMGPAQPYLASQVGVDHQTISLLWSARAAGITLACLTSGPSFGTERMNSSIKRLLFLGVAQIITSLCLITVPFVKNYFALLTIYGIMTFGSGSFDVADNGLMNMMLGPELSRPMVQSLHACVAIGFVLVAFLMPLFLPGSSTSSEEICAKLRGDPLEPAWDQNIQRLWNLTGQNETLFAQENVETSDWPILILPFTLCGCWLLLVGLGFLCLALLTGTQLPSFHSHKLVPTSDKSPESLGDLPQSLTTTDELKSAALSNEVSNTNSPSPSTTAQNKILPRTIILITLGVLFYFLTCGVDSYFQSQTYTFGLCGPLDMSAKAAGWLNSIYFGLYLVGRLISIPLSTVLSPTGIITASLVGCLTAAGILVSIGTFNVLALFLATGLMGFCACFQFGSGITWLSSNIPNMSSRQVSFIFLGANLANCVFPPLASKLFNDLDPNWVFYLTMLSLILTIVCFLFMNLVANKLMIQNPSHSNSLKAINE